MGKPASRGSRSGQISSQSGHGCCIFVDCQQINSDLRVYPYYIQHVGTLNFVHRLAIQRRYILKPPIKGLEMRKDYSFTMYLGLKACLCFIGYAFGTQDFAFLFAAVGSLLFMPAALYIENQGA